MQRSTGERVTHPRSGEHGTIDAVTVHPDGVQLVRLNDHWFFAHDTLRKGK